MFRQCGVQNADYRNRIADPAHPGLLTFAAIGTHFAGQAGEGMKTDLATRRRRVSDIVSRSDWRILRDTVLESVATSPDSFLASAERLKKEPPDYWKDQLGSSTWAAVERGNKILGIAATKPPGELDGYASQEEARFIESVWIDPEMRGNGFGERLVAYIIEQERSRAGIHQFYLWVFEHNTPAIRLYERMGFKRTRRASELDPPEIQFLRTFDSDVFDDGEQKLSGARRMRDRRDFGITYRLLTVNPARSYLSRPDVLPVWQVAGSMSRNLKAAMWESRRGRLVR